MDRINFILQIVVHGDNDTTILVTQSRAMVKPPANSARN
jgi:hypothetical protein